MGGIEGGEIDGINGTEVLRGGGVATWESDATAAVSTIIEVGIAAVVSSVPGTIEAVSVADGLTSETTSENDSLGPMLGMSTAVVTVNSISVLVSRDYYSYYHFLGSGLVKGPGQHVSFSYG